MILVSRLAAAISRDFPPESQPLIPVEDHHATAERGAEILAVFQGVAHVFRQGFEAIEALRRGAGGARQRKTQKRSNSASGAISSELRS